jgi:hypothetical protein
MTTIRLTLPPPPSSFWRNKKSVILHPPYYPDWVPCDIFLFPKLNLKLKERRFDTTEELHAESQRALDTVTEKDLHEAGMNYFESDGGRQALW